MPKTYKNILIIKMSSLGDIIHALPSLYALRKAYPDARITWAVHPAFAGILPGKPWIDEVYLVDRKRIKQLSYWREIRKDLHAHHFDLVIDLQMIAKSGLISFLSGGKKRSATTMAEKAASSSASRFPDPTSTDTLSNSF